MERKNIWGLSAGVVLIGLGIIFFLGQMFRFNVMRYLWPLFILAAGALFFVGMVAGGRSLGALAVPGSVIATIGLILFVQNIFGIWSTWAYAWALIIVGAGIGLLIFGLWSQIHDLFRAGRVVIVVGLALFFVFGMIFELGASLLGIRSFGGIAWAVLLILIGLYIVFAPRLMHSMGESGPVTRSTVAFDSPAATEASTETNTISGVRRVIFRTFGDITIVQGPREGLEIEASPAARERLSTKVTGDTLEIHYDHNWLDWLQPRYWNISTPLRYTLYVRDLAFLDAAGMGNVLIPSLLTPRLELQVHGAGNVSARQLEAGDLIVLHSGLGNIEVEGRANHQEMRLSGAGNYNAARLESGSASIQLSGLGTAQVWVRDALEARVSGAGNVEYFGSPRVTEQVSGLGGVRHLGAR